MSLGFRVSKFSQNMDGSNIFSIKSITYSWAWVLLLLEKIFEFWSKIYGMLWLMAQCLPPKSVVYTHDLGLSWFDFFFEWAQNLGYIMALWIISSSSFWTFDFKNKFPFLFPFLIFNCFSFNFFLIPLLKKYLQKIFFIFLKNFLLYKRLSSFLGIFLNFFFYVKSNKDQTRALRLPYELDLGLHYVWVRPLMLKGEDQQDTHN